MHDTGIRNSELCVLYDHLLPVLVGRTALLATVVVRSTGNLLHLRHLAFLWVSLYDSLSMGEVRGEGGYPSIFTLDVLLL